MHTPVPGAGNKCAYSCSADADCASYPAFADLQDQVECFSDGPNDTQICPPKSPSGPSGAPKIWQPKGLVEYEGPSKCMECDAVGDGKGTCR
jgi:hypothetical protein